MIIVTAMLGLLIPATLCAQEQTVGLFQYDSTAFDGYTLFSPMRSTSTYLIDMYGRLVHSWEHDYPPGNSVYLLENGHLLRPARPDNGGGGLIEEFDWDGTLLWQYEYYTEDFRQHHDIEYLPNGNVLLLAWEYKTLAEAVAAGRDSSLMWDDELWPEHLVEIQRIDDSTDSIVWEWHLWDHLIQYTHPAKPNFGIIAEYPERVNINFVSLGGQDWIHANSIDYNPELDQIIISSRMLSEFWVIDHSTTTAEAAGSSGGNSGMGGDILYRWGNPQGYDGGSPDDQQLFYQHDVQWIEPGCPGEGNILVFNNGGIEQPYSSVDEITPPVDGNGHYPLPSPGEAHGPTAPSWSYLADPPVAFYSSFLSGATRLPNGNTLICAGDGGTFFEVTSDDDMVWEYINPVSGAGPASQGDSPGHNNVFRCYRYAADYPGLVGHNLTPGGPLELNPVQIAGTSHSPSLPTDRDSVAVTSFVTSSQILLSVNLHIDTGDGYQVFQMFDDGLHHDGNADDSLFGTITPPLPAATNVRYYVSADNIISDTTYDPPSCPTTAYWYTVELFFVCGNVNNDLNDSVNIQDLTYLIAYLFSGGAPPPIPAAADINNSGTVNVADLTMLVAYLFFGGSPPNCG